MPGITQASSCFNPRAPEGARQTRSLIRTPKTPVSIHAPPKGRDRWKWSWFFSSSQFQSTRPRRGATRYTAAQSGGHRRFNPRAPEGARLAKIEGLVGISRVSIHAPPKGRDGRSWQRSLRARTVSIHAPPKGRDRWCRVALRFQYGFNPRAPEGARRGDLDRSTYKSYVSIHAPPKGRDVNSIR